MAKKIKGTLDTFAETGTEGIYWVLYDSSMQGYNSLHKIEDGDSLTVYESKKIHWQGKINFDYEIQKGNLGQRILGCSVHGLQKGVKPEFWAKMFFDKMNAELTKGEENDQNFRKKSLP